MLLQRILAVALFSSCPLCLANSFDVNLNNNMAQARVGVAAGGLEGNAEFQGGLLYNDQGNILADAGVKMKGSGEEATSGPVAGGGLKGVFGTIHQAAATNTVACIAIGIEMGYALATSVPIAFIGEYIGAPKILTFADADRFNQFGVRVEVAATSQAKIYYGYREFAFGIKNTGNAILDMGYHVGMALSFE